MYWTHLYESPETLIQLYHDRGSSEQFHSELKNDMAFERFPSGKIDVNTILLPIAMIAVQHFTENWSGRADHGLAAML